MKIKVSKKAPNKTAPKKPRKVHVGSTLRTRDEYLSSGRGKKDIKPDHPSPTDLYRTAGVVAMNDRGELAVVKFTTKGRHELADYLNGESTYKAFIEIKTNNGKRIVVDKVRFVQNSSERDLSEAHVQKILNDCLKNPETSRSLRKSNKRKLTMLKRK